MPNRARKVCSAPGCPELIESGHNRCDTCERGAEQRRGSARRRGYDRQHEAVFREAVLARDPICKADGCFVRSKHADHWPLDRRTLELRGLNPNDPKHGRGLCHSCHSRETAAAQPGGWNVR